MPLVKQMGNYDKCILQVVEVVRRSVCEQRCGCLCVDGIMQDYKDLVPFYKKYLLQQLNYEWKGCKRKWVYQSEGLYIYMLLLLLHIVYRQTELH